MFDHILFYFTGAIDSAFHTSLRDSVTSATDSVAMGDVFLIFRQNSHHYLRGKYYLLPLSNINADSVCKCSHSRAHIHAKGHFFVICSHAEVLKYHTFLLKTADIRSINPQ